MNTVNNKIIPKMKPLRRCTYIGIENSMVFIEALRARLFSAQCVHCANAPAHFPSEKRLAKPQSKHKL